MQIQNYQGGIGFGLYNSKKRLGMGITMPEFGEIMAELRQDAGMSQQELAAKLFVAPSTISNYETGQRRAHAEFICKVADVFNVSTDYFLGRIEFRPPLAMINDEYVDGKSVSTVLIQAMSLSSQRRRILCVLLNDMQRAEKGYDGK